jgi:hypothetical protein
MVMHRAPTARSIQGKIALTAPATDDVCYQMVEVKSAATAAAKRHQLAGKERMRRSREKKEEAGCKLITSGKAILDMTGQEVECVSKYKHLKFPSEMTKVGQKRTWLAAELSKTSQLGAPPKQLLLTNGA